MKKVTKKIVGFIALVLILGGLLVLGWEYFRNKQLFEVLMNNSIVKGSAVVLKKMLLALGAMILGLIISSVYFKLGSSIRRDEREKRQLQKEREKEQEELNKQLKKEAEEAKAEAEAVKKENEELQESLKEE
ncbi:MAG: hypothetical protein IKE33_00745 [Erysipelotrichaceae bacterium]|nr:hypothetical protein [Erysipelotrichaceae bacterium]